jgi:hypothetical protein
MPFTPPQLYVLTLEDTGELDPQMKGCWYRFVGELVPIDKLSAFTPATSERTMLTFEHLWRLVDADPSFLPCPILPLEEFNAIFLIYSFRIRKPPAPVSGIRWWAQGREFYSIMGVGANRMAKRDTDQVWRWWKRTRFQERRGAPPLEDEELARRHAKLIETLDVLRTGKLKPTQKNFMKVMGMTRDQPARLTEMCQQLGYKDFRDFVKQHWITGAN